MFAMMMKSVLARYDGSKVLFDEAIVIPTDARLVVTILEDVDTDRSDFQRLASTAFADAFDEDEVEYSEADLRS